MRLFGVVLACLVFGWAVSGTAAPGQRPNQLPTVYITAPSPAGSIAVPFLISAKASDPDGSIASVSFYVNGTLIATAMEAPYRALWADVEPGKYTLTAVAVDNAGGSSTSSAVVVTVGSSK